MLLDYLLQFIIMIILIYGQTVSHISYYQMRTNQKKIWFTESNPNVILVLHFIFIVTFVQELVQTGTGFPPWLFHSKSTVWEWALA